MGPFVVGTGQSSRDFSNGARQISEAFRCFLRQRTFGEVHQAKSYFRWCGSVRVPRRTEGISYQELPNVLHSTMMTAWMFIAHLIALQTGIPTRPSSMCKRCGVTIVELFVVLAIIAALLALLLPVVQSVRERARETLCKNNVHQLNVALAHFAEAHKRLPGPNPRDRVGGWMVAILPFVEQPALARHVTVGTPTSAVPEIMFAPPPLFRCPRRTALDRAPVGSSWPGHYVFVPASQRESFLLFDAPIDFNVPWLSGPEMTYDAVVQATGPHHGGFFFSRGFQEGVELMIDGRVVK